MDQRDVIMEFVLQAAGPKGSITFGQRGGPSGYTKVFGPNATSQPQSCHIAIEHRYPAVSVTSTLAEAVGAKPRRGWSSGPNGGRFQHDILLTEAAEKFDSPEDFVRHLVDAAKAKGVW